MGTPKDLMASHGWEHLFRQTHNVGAQLLMAGRRQQSLGEQTNKSGGINQSETCPFASDKPKVGGKNNL